MEYKHRSNRTRAWGYKTVFSEDGKYRYCLSRVWNPNKPWVLFIGLNPSTADANEDDATVRKLRTFANKWGYGGFTIINVFAYIATDRRELSKTDNPIGPDNLKWIKRFMRHKHVVFMWGASKYVRNNDWVDMVKRRFKNAKCFKQTPEGHPYHPLFLSYDTKPIKFSSQ